ncbi:MAG TPA: (2Fe-2S)-binding protein [Acidimicrobiales bacterium]|nr:(2Fe-2S)-binding protein [Acidimicrobiales bacterium]
MFVCGCRAVTDREVHDAVQQGARSAAEVAAHCGAGSRCGNCLDLVLAVIEASTPAEREVALPALARSA